MVLYSPRTTHDDFTGGGAVVGRVQWWEERRYGRRNGSLVFVSNKESLGPNRNLSAPTLLEKDVGGTYPEGSIETVG